MPLTAEEIAAVGPQTIIGHIRTFFARLVGTYVLIYRPDYSNDNITLVMFRTRLSYKAYKVTVFERERVYEPGARINEVIEKLQEVNNLWGIKTHVVHGSLEGTPWSIKKEN